MAKQCHQSAQTVEYWAGKKRTRNLPDLFLDRPRSGKTIFSGILI